MSDKSQRLKKQYQGLDLENLRLYCYFSEADGTMVVEVETKETMEENENGPKIRVYLNDDVLFENPPYPVEN